MDDPSKCILGRNLRSDNWNPNNIFNGRSVGQTLKLYPIFTNSK